MRSLIVACFALVAIVQVHGHGRLREPPSRSSLWRDKEFAIYEPEINYQDNELFCGGFKRQWEDNGGRCGICGDAYDEPQPRANEGGGLFGRGIIVRNYTSGQEIDIKVELTASHLGYFIVKICPHDNPLVPVEQSCLDQYPLELADGSGYRFEIKTLESKTYTYKVKLPQGLTCRQCVFQWHYNCGNSWGSCDDGSQGIGCGAQETFRGCADVAIH